MLPFEAIQCLVVSYDIALDVGKAMWKWKGSYFLAFVILGTRARNE